MKPENERQLHKRQHWVSSVTYDAIKHFVWGIGDSNPLWATTAPPSFLYAIDETTIALEHEGHQRHYESVTLEWFQPFVIGENIHIEQSYEKEVFEDGKSIFHQTGKTRFINELGEVLAESTVICRRDMRPLPEPENRPEIRYSAEELAAIERKILAEQRRGPEPRFWEDTKKGEGLGNVTKGPLSIMDVVAWCSGTQGAPNNSKDFSTGGLLTQAATGPQATSWLIHLITNWLGDHGTLVRLEADLRGNPFLGSTTTISGTVINLGKNENASWCELSLQGHLQDSERIIEGTAIVHLPSKGNQ